VPQVPTAGLLNIVGAPHLTFDSTYRATYTPSLVPSFKTPQSDAMVEAAAKGQEALGYPAKVLGLFLCWCLLLLAALSRSEHTVELRPSISQPNQPNHQSNHSKPKHNTRNQTIPHNPTQQVGGYWSNGQPYLDTSVKATPTPWEGGLQLPLAHFDVSEAKAFLQSMPPEVWTHEYQAAHSAVMGGRDTNMNAFKPGVQGITLLFSAGSGEGPVFEFPLYKRFAHLLEPMLEEVRSAALLGCLDAWGVSPVWRFSCFLMLQTLIHLQLFSRYDQL